MSGTKTYISYNIGKYVDGIGHTITQHLSSQKNDKTKNSIVNSFYCVVDFPVPGMAHIFEPHLFNKRKWAMMNAKQVCAALNAMEAAKRHTTRKGKPRKKKVKD